MRLFIGKAVKAEAALIKTNTGRALTDEWLHEFRGRRNEGLLPIRGALEAVAQIHTLYQGRIACASGADRFMVKLQLEKCGPMPCFKDRIFSGHEMPRSKPSPDLHLRTAAKPARATQYNAYI